MPIREWLITKADRANPRTTIDDRHPGDQAWSDGDRATPLIHGATYFAELYERIEATGPGDLVWFTDWRGDPDERFVAGDPNSEVAAVLARAARRGVDVRGLVWRSHWDKLSFSGTENRRFGEQLQSAGAEVLLDMRVRTGGSHHQKLVVIRHRDDPTRDVAYVGGIDLCHSRRDDADHGGDPQAQAMAEDFGDSPPWHDAQVRLQGPVVHDVETVFRERWTDPTPLSRSPIRMTADRMRGDDTRPDPLPAQAPPPPPVPGSTHHVQLLRTYPDLRHGRDYPFARGGERSVARGYSKALERADHLIYIEDQYLWSADVAEQFVETLSTSPDLHVIAVLPQMPDQSSPLSRIPQLYGRHKALDLITRAGGDRVAAYGLENSAGTPVYVHAKVCVMDDRWATIGSDNFNRRSWTHDSELSAVVWDDEGGDHSAYARRLRLRLAAEHLGRELSPDPSDAELADVMADCLTAEGTFAAYAACARRLDEWHAGGEVGERPPGRLRRLAPVEQGPVTRAWARLVYRWVHDPDGRPAPLRRAGRF
ncbi:phospholipase D family protein [Arsenicicoccus sp. oral taxon 190]|uniref:phospholipase D family protein n=1 Tax=Arsenicicoccus sp. oral taxon 190 TaxID=1658671 RepID=UPI00067A05BB|nr:phospholipase D-like domain-containing protein [Arsenicicoccus sp. oral taxon 190]AKT52635.1 phospholipase D [Arsenicicoccus sp. oral taxon 190]